MDQPTSRSLLGVCAAGGLLPLRRAGQSRRCGVRKVESRMDARSFGRRGLTALAVPLLLAGGLTWTGPGQASASACVSWTGTQPPAPTSPPHFKFRGVTVLSRCNAWTVGGYSTLTNDLTLIDHWNGSEWKQVASPNPGSRNGLGGVAAVSASNIWAVGGYYSPTAAAGKTLILHWNGTAWKKVASPSPGSIGNFLSGVAAVSASNAWAVGGYTSGTGYQTLILHWNGTAWKKVASPSPSPSGDSVLSGVAAVSARNAWAVGHYYSPTAAADKTLILHWNGTAWTKVASPSPGTESNDLNGVTAISASNAWAVGVHWTSNGTTHSLVLHWNGAAWKKVASPSPGTESNDLYSVTAISPSNAWAVGSYNDRTFVLHWNGTAWQRVASPNFGTSPGQNVLTSVAASSATNIWAVGFHQKPSEVDPLEYTAQGIAIHCC
jgi:hypothetical protein